MYKRRLVSACACRGGYCRIRHVGGRYGCTAPVNDKHHRSADVELRRNAAREGSPRLRVLRAARRAVDPGERDRDAAEPAIGQEVDPYVDDVAIALPHHREPPGRVALSADQRHAPPPVALDVGMAFALCIPSVAGIPSKRERDESTE